MECHRAIGPCSAGTVKRDDSIETQIIRRSPGAIRRRGPRALRALGPSGPYDPRHFRALAFRASARALEAGGSQSAPDHIPNYPADCVSGTKYVFASS